MSFGRYFYTNLIKSSAPTLTASSANSSYPVANVKTDNYSEVWRTTAAGATAETIVADFGSATAIASCAIGNVNFRSTATVKIQGNATDSWGSPSVDQTINTTGLTGYRRCLYHEFNSASYRYWRLSITDNGNPDGFLEVGEWFLGTAITPTDGPDSGIPKRLTRSNIELRTEYEQAYVYARDWAYEIGLTWSNIQAASVTELETLTQTVQGNKLPWFLVLDPTAPADVYYVRINSDLEVARVHYNRYSAKLGVMEETPGLIVPK